VRTEVLIGAQWRQRIEATSASTALELTENGRCTAARAPSAGKVTSLERDLATRTVDTHVSQMRKKLDLRPESGYRVVPIYNYGYRLEKISPVA